MRADRERLFERVLGAARKRRAQDAASKAWREENPARVAAFVESRSLLLSCARFGAHEGRTLRNEQFCREWISEFWRPSVGPVVACIGSTELASFDPGDDLLRIVGDLYGETVSRCAEDATADLDDVASEWLRVRESLGERGVAAYAYFGRLARAMPIYDRFELHRRMFDESAGASAEELDPFCDHPLIDDTPEMAEGPVQLHISRRSVDTFEVSKAIGGLVVYQAVVRGPTRAAVFDIVVAAPGKVHSWQDVLKALWERGVTSPASRDNVRRQGNYIRQDLEELGVYWEQSSTAVCWNPPDLAEGAEEDLT